MGLFVYIKIIVTFESWETNNPGLNHINYNIMKNFRTTKSTRKSKSDKQNSIALSLGFKNAQAAISKMGKEFLEYVN